METSKVTLINEEPGTDGIAKSTITIKFDGDCDVFEFYEQIESFARAIGYAQESINSAMEARIDEQAK